MELRKGSVFGVSAVITVTFHDIEKIALTPTKTSAVDGAVSLNHKEAQCSEVPVEYKRKAKSESEGGDDRHVSVIGDVSGFAVSAVSAVILLDINEMELTASDISPVSVAVSAVSRHQIFLNRRSK